LEISPSELIGHNEHVVQDNSFEVLVTDDSMEPDIKIGDKIRAIKSADLHDGDFVVADLASTPGSAPVVRQVMHIGNLFVLIPYNREYPYQTETEFKIRGKAVELVRKI
jgi:SOS-response transcriptional repressor LexA